MSRSSQAFPFELEGEFTGFVGKSGKPLKYMGLAIAHQELSIKLARALRPILASEVVPGDRLRVFGRKKSNGAFKADRVERLTCTLHHCPSANLPATESGKILLCQKSGCRKRGSEQLYVALEQSLKELGLQNSVRIERTGCQKRCKKAPNFVLMPEKVKCAAIAPKAIPALLERHYSRG